ncbi:MAG: hypothetical protein ACR2OZ_06710 [Verrucomicrobiales bacterium]
MRRFRLEQPVLSGFFLTAENGLAAEIESGQLLLFGVWVWLVFQKAGGAKQEITAENIEAAFDLNHQQLRGLENSSDENVMDQAADWTSSYRQMPLLGAVINQLLTANSDERPRIDDQLGLLTLYFKTAIDCLDR